MATANFNMRLDQDLKERAFSIIESYGLTPAQAIKLFLNQIAETKAVPISLDYQQSHFNFDLDRMKKMINSETVAMPAEIKDAEKIREWLING